MDVISAIQEMPQRKRSRGDEEEEEENRKEEDAKPDECLEVVEEVAVVTKQEAVEMMDTIMEVMEPQTDLAELEENVFMEESSPMEENIKSEKFTKGPKLASRQPLSFSAAMDELDGLLGL